MQAENEKRVREKAAGEEAYHNQQNPPPYNYNIMDDNGKHIQEPSAPPPEFCYNHDYHFDAPPPYSP